MSFKSDIEIAREAVKKPIQEIGAKLGIPEKDLVPFGHDKAKISADYLDSLSDRRGSATIAQTLYTETEDSIAKRELIAEQRRAAGGQVRSEGRPNKKDRRQIHQFRSRNQ